MKLLRTIQLDPSDTFVFENAAEPGEWAVSGAFAFWGRDVSKLEGKPRSAFRSGFLGVASLGWSTLTQIVQAKASDRQGIVDELAAQLVRNFGAPDRQSALAAAEDEVTFVESLCDHPSGTLIAVHRIYEDGEIREAFRTLQSAPKPLPVFSFEEVADEEEPGEKIDLAGLAGERGPK